MKRVAPLLGGYFLLVGLAIGLDVILHSVNMLWVGRYLGIVGTALILLSFIYSARKRKLLRAGSPKALLEAHELLSCAGALMLLVHAGVHFNAVLPWLALVLMLVVVASGFTGKMLLKEARERFKLRQDELRRQGMSADQIERKLFFDLVAVDMMKNWRAFHIPITTIFATLAILHILAIFVLWRW